MKRFAIALALWFGLAVAPLAQDRDIESTISAQISAFLADDLSAAFDHASPSIQTLFQTPENFGVMVRRGYPMVWRPDDVRFLELREIAGNLWQKVMIRDGAGQIHLLDYQMVRSEGAWKINGVQILRAPQGNV